MIELTVKTLDSQNHQFSVEDDITVEQFKIKIADTVNIPADTQRIIYCGRVLQDSSKLADYDVHGKVVHLVQRPPPGASTPLQNSRSTSPQPQRRNFRGFRGFRDLEQGNAMYLGSMAFPGNLMESQGIVPPPPTHSLSGSRLNVARRMLNRAEAVIRLLENPNARQQEQSATNENQEEEEVTPVIEARVILPSNFDTIENLNAEINAVENTLNNTTRNANSSSTSSANATQLGEALRSENSSENLNAEQRPAANNSLPENASRTTEMSDLLTLLGQLQGRLAPFLERYQTFMRDDPEVPADNQRETQIMLNRVSEVMHFLGHAYHSLSDIIVRVRTPPPRPLLCRPILIQHSAVVQTGIPIQVEAQIGISADRLNPPTTNATTTTANSGSAESTTTTTTTASANNPSTTPSRQGITVQPGFVSLPFLPSTAMRVQSFPVEIRSVRPMTQLRTQTAAPNEASNAPAPNAENTPNATNNNNSNANAQDNQPQGGFNFNPNVDIFMEVTPEGITIDSLETTLVGSSNQANDLLRGALNGPTPEFLQSLMQMAGQIINRNVQTTGNPAGDTTTQAQTTQQGSTAAGQAQQTPSGQNSQARGNTQTHPTTSTYTRSTPRPHVHLAQQAMQGGFDPFLPCNSHHISRRNRTQQQQQQQQQAASSSAANAPGQSAGGQQAREESSASGDQRNSRENPNILNFINRINEVLSDQRRGGENVSWPTSAPNASNSTSNGDGGLGGLNMGSIGSLFSGLQGSLNLPDLLGQGPTLEQLLQQFQQDDQYVPGESIIIDLIMLIVRNLTIIDIFSLYSGNAEPINRNINDIQNFFRTRICEEDTSPAGVERAVEKLIRELQSFLENFASLPVRNNIDIVRSSEQLFRQRLPNIIVVALNLNSNTTSILVDQCITTAKQLLALTLLASSSGQRGVEQVFERIMTNIMRDIPQDIINWTVVTSRMQLRQILSGLNIPESALQPFIVHKAAQPPQEPPQSLPTDAQTVAQVYNEVELMDVDVQDVRTDLVVADSEPLPNVVIGSESWHGQVPEDWVPIITKDAQKQRRQNPQAAFSDAYLSGMPSKRRKIINSSKPHGSLSQVISESVRQAVTASGLTSVAPLEVVAQAAGASSDIQNSYRNLLRSTVQNNLKDNEDFHPDRYPNVSNYFNSNPQ
ncbi:unnamed protein product [Phyllotreta striolata]|uniref:Large proline-rich protein BAG6 n=1 Tax=Phyllotreta striolata TaxID=444603 RepID=A0A9N9TIE7_PHYSR|nr:unnamed protein product [Phyllotreta striolata]